MVIKYTPLLILRRGRKHYLAPCRPVPTPLPKYVGVFTSSSIKPCRVYLGRRSPDRPQLPCGEVTLPHRIEPPNRP